MLLLNVGCGSTYHPAWANLDLNPSSPAVKKWDIQRGLPFPSGSVDAVYHSHVLEHFPRPDGEAFIRECGRALKTGGILRIAIPDLEQIARIYLEKLELAARGDDQAARDYDWILLELFDQTVREASGGEMSAYLSQPQISNVAFVLSRIGEEGRALIEQSRKSAARTPSFLEKSAVARKLSGKSPAQVWAKLRAIGLGGIFWKLRVAIASLFVLLFAGRKGLHSFRAGVFRSQGEVHQWMYDRYSVARLLREAGFEDVRVCRHDESLIPGFAAFGLDSAGGDARKPDSLYVEARKAKPGH